MNIAVKGLRNVIEYDKDEYTGTISIIGNDNYIKLPPPPVFEGIFK